MKDVKLAARAIKEGADAKEVFGRYGIELRPCGPDLLLPSAPQFASKVTPAAARLPQEARSFQDFATKRCTDIAHNHP
jgi:hypothetical protein